MKRPIAVLGAAAIILPISFYLFGMAFAAVSLLAAAVGLPFCFLLKGKDNKRISALCLAAVVLFSVRYMVYFSFVYTPAVSLSDKTVNISGKVTECGERMYGKYYYTIKTDEINGEKRRVKIRLSADENGIAEIGDRVSGEVSLSVINDTSNRYKAKGVFLRAAVSDKLEFRKPENRPLFYYINEVKEYLLSNISNALPGEEGNLLKGMLLGETDGIPQEITENFRLTGLSHIFAVSGLHLSVWTALFLSVKWEYHIIRTVMRLLSGGFIIFFMALTGFTSSVFRAGVMTLVYLLGLQLGRRADGLTSMGTAAVILSLINPFSPLQIGFLLSFSAAAGILLTHKKVEKIAKRVSGKIKIKALKYVFCKLVAAFGVSLFAYVFVLPVSSVVFGEVSLIAPFTNLIIPGITSISMVLGGIGAVLPDVSFFAFLSKPLFFVSGVINKFVIWFTSLLSEKAFTHFTLKFEVASLILVGIFLLFAVTFLFKNYKKLIPFTTFLCIAFSLFVILTDTFLCADTADITVCDFGENSSVVISENGRSLIIGGSGDYITQTNLKNALRRAGKSKADYLVLTENDMKKNKGAYRVYEASGEPGVITAGEARPPWLKETSVRIKTEGGTVKFSENISAEIYGDFTFITYGKIKILISKGNAESISDVFGENMKFDILISAEKPPADYEKFGFSYIIVMCSEDYLKENKNEIPAGENVSVTGGMGSVTVKARPEGYYTVRRSR